jgi:hypothetical protein
MPEFLKRIISEPIANAVNKEYEIMKRYGSKGIQIPFSKKVANTRYSGKTTTEQNNGSRDANTIITHVIFEMLVSSSHLFFLNVVNLHAKEAKLNTEITGVIRGNANINRI